MFDTDLPDDDYGDPVEVDPIHPTPGVEDEVDGILADLIGRRRPSRTRRVLGWLRPGRRHDAAGPDWTTPFADHDLTVVTGDYIRTLILDRDSARAAAAWRRLTETHPPVADRTDPVPAANAGSVAA